MSDFGVKRVIVPELNAGQMYLEIERAIRGEAETFSRTLLNGELFEPSQIVRFIEEVA